MIRSISSQHSPHPSPYDDSKSRIGIKSYSIIIGIRFPVAASLLGFSCAYWLMIGFLLVERMPQSPLSPIEIPEGYPFRDALLAFSPPYGVSTKNSSASRFITIRHYLIYFITCQHPRILTMSMKIIKVMPKIFPHSIISRTCTDGSNDRLPMGGA